MNPNKEPDPREVYADIIGLPHHVSEKRRPMSLHDRAAQFAPFAALTGYDEMISEEAWSLNHPVCPAETDPDLIPDPDPEDL